mmetsp:Transcript_21305/g.59288  ORF Transcript_21305/g.59288 Transcript_21305/m.59288 type:complete len:237 (+) Transcript_21305:182-892(+)
MSCHVMLCYLVWSFLATCLASCLVYVVSCLCRVASHIHGVFRHGRNGRQGLLLDGPLFPLGKGPALPSFENVIDRAAHADGPHHGSDHRTKQCPDRGASHPVHRAGALAKVLHGRCGGEHRSRGRRCRRRCRRRRHSRQWRTRAASENKPVAGIQQRERAVQSLCPRCGFAGIAIAIAPIFGIAIIVMVRIKIRIRISISIKIKIRIHQGVGDHDSRSLALRGLGRRFDKVRERCC